MHNYRSLGWSRNTYIVLREETRAELQIIIQIERAPCFKARTECCHRRSLRQLSHAFHTPELPLGVLRSHAGASTRAAAMVAVGSRSHVGSSGSVVLLVLLLRVVSVEVCRHGDGMDWQRVLSEQHPAGSAGRLEAGAARRRNTLVKQERKEEGRKEMS